MKKFISGMCATALAATFAVTSIVPVNAAPIFVPRAKAVQDEAGRADVIQVQDGFRYKRRNWNNTNNNWNRNNFHRSGNYGWYNGHRGYRYKRYGYRYYNGFWFPASCLHSRSGDRRRDRQQQQLRRRQFPRSVVL